MVPENKQNRKKSTSLPHSHDLAFGACRRQIRGVRWVDFFLFPKEVFADSFQKFYERSQQCVVKVGDYFEGQ
jgi:hypothetical protein